MNKRILLLSCTSILMLLFSSCVSPDEIMKSYAGSRINVVILNWGPADDVQPDGQGGKVYTWYIARQGYTASRTFLCDNTGLIYAYRWKGY